MITISTPVNKRAKYVHDETAHNLKDARIIVPVIMNVLHPESVIDVGCGIGIFLRVFAENGVKKILGLDGNWVNINLLSKHISLNNFQFIDIEKGFKINEKFDLAVCLEVFEHIESAYAETAVKCLTVLSDIIVFSASIPGQMGQNHVNEQWPEYWIKKFRVYGFNFYDVLRPIFWNNKDLARWYKQNLFLVVKNGHESMLNEFNKYFDPSIKSLVHPEYYNLRIKELEHINNQNEILTNKFATIVKGEAKFSLYLKLLIKYFYRKIFPNK